MSRKTDRLLAEVLRLARLIEGEQGQEGLRRVLERMLVARAEARQ